MRELQEVYCPKGELRLRKTNKAIIRTHAHINQGVANPKPKRYSRVHAYSKGAFLEVPETLY